MKKAWLCYWFDELEIKPDVVNVVFEEPDLDTRAKYHKIVPITYLEANEAEFPIDHDIPFFLKKQAN